MIPLRSLSFPFILSLALVVVFSGYALGQFRETYEPPGYIFEWGQEGSGNGEFSGPYDLAVDTSGNIYVADNDNRRIQKFDGTGSFLTEWAMTGVGLPVSVAVDSFSEIVYVADNDNHRVQKFDSAGNFLEWWAMSNPAGVAVDAFGNVYVTTESPDVRKLDSLGSILTQWGSSGSGDGQFSSPKGVAVDASTNVYVVDAGNHRIQKFDSAGNFLAKWGSNGSGDGQFNNPNGVALDALGNVYVADTGNHRIQKFDSLGNFIMKWGSSGSGNGEFNNPKGLALDASGSVYVSDTGNHRIQKFAPVLWFDVAGYDSYLSVATLHETTAVRTLFQLENNGAPRFAFKNTNSDIEWSFQQSGPGNFLISKEGTGGPEMQVYQTGMVRMGPGGANNFTLSSSGNLTIKGSLTANGSTFPDYVFEPDYDLMPLADLRIYIQRQKRLPDIPSAEEVKRQGGHNMTELQLKLLEKIEELTLYTLEQDQRLRHKDGEIGELKARLAAIEEMLSGR